MAISRKSGLKMTIWSGEQFQQTVLDKGVHWDYRSYLMEGINSSMSRRVSRKFRKFVLSCLEFLLMLLQKIQAQGGAGAE